MNLLIHRFISFTLNNLLLIFFSSLILFSYVRMQINGLISTEVTLWVGLSIIIILGLSRFLVSLTSKVYIIVLLAIGLLLRISWIFLIDTPLASDFMVLFNAAIEVADGKNNYLNNFYFQKWSYQLGFSFYEALIIKIFGPYTFPLKLMNIFFSVGTSVIIYKVSSHIFNEFTGRIAGILYACYIPSIVMASVLSNQHLSTFLFFLGCYLIIRFDLKDNKSWIFIGLLFALGNLARPLGSFILLAVGIYVIVKVILSGKKKIFINLSIKFIGIIGVYLIIQQMLFYLFIAVDIAEKPLNNEDSLWKFVAGFNYESKGSYSSEDKDYLDQFELGEERNEKSMELIKERLSDKKKVALLLKHKIAYMWGGKDLSIHWSLLRTETEEHIYLLLYKTEKIIYITMAIFGVISSIFLLKKKERNENYYLLSLLIIGYAAIHVLIEVQTRYRYDIMPALFIIQSYGIYSMCYFISKKTKLNLVK